MKKIILTAILVLTAIAVLGATHQALAKPCRDGQYCVPPMPSPIPAAL